MLSIIVPVYNTEKFLEKCLESLVNQTYKDVEIIIVNDGSTDNSSVICEKWQEKDSRIKVISQPNSGLVSAWTKGVLSSKGEYIGFVDSDDYCDISYFNNLMDKMTQSKADLAIGGHIWETETEKIKVNASTKFANNSYEGEALNELKDSLFDSNGNMCWARWVKIFSRRLILNNLDYVDKRICVGEDVGISISSIYDSKKVVLVEEYGYHYVQHVSSMMRSVSEKEVNNFELLCDNVKNICEAKQRVKNLHRFYTYQMVVVLSKILHSNLEKDKKKQLLKSLRSVNYVDYIYTMKDFGWLSAKQRIAVRLFQNKLFGLMTLIA